jgi:hypothetical protein
MYSISCYKELLNFENTLYSGALGNFVQKFILKIKQCQYI